MEVIGIELQKVALQLSSTIFQALQLLHLPSKTVGRSGVGAKLSHYVAKELFKVDPISAHFFMSLLRVVSQS